MYGNRCKTDVKFKPWWYNYLNLKGQLLSIKVMITILKNLEQCNTMHVIKLTCSTKASLLIKGLSILSMPYLFTHLTGHNLGSLTFFNDYLYFGWRFPNYQQKPLKQKLNVLKEGSDSIMTIKYWSI